MEMPYMSQLTALCRRADLPVLHNGRIGLQCLDQDLALHHARSTLRCENAKDIPYAPFAL